MVYFIWQPLAGLVYKQSNAEKNLQNTNNTNR